jgi:hypothetical protein
VGNPIARSSIRRKAERNTSPNKAHTNEIETKQKVENDLPDILDMEMAKQSMRNYIASGTDNINQTLQKKGGRCCVA